MTTDLTSHAFGDGALRTIVDDDSTIWLVAADVAGFLGYRMASDMLRSLDESEKGTRLVRTPGGGQNMAVITEPGFYQAVMQRQTGRMNDLAAMAKVRSFQQWVSGVVLPSIRRTGRYDVEPLTGTALIAAAVIEAQQIIDRQSQRIAELEPPAQAWTALADASGDYSLRDAAQILSRDPDIEIGQNRLARYLRQVGWIDQRGVPYQSQIGLGRVASRARTYDHPRTGERVQADPQVRVTAKGLTWLHQHLGGTEPLDTTTRHLTAVGS